MPASECSGILGEGWDITPPPLMTTLAAALALDPTPPTPLTACNCGDECMALNRVEAEWCKCTGGKRLRLKA